MSFRWSFGKHNWDTTVHNESFYIKVQCEKRHFSSRLQFHACLNPCYIIVKDKHLYISAASLCIILHVAAGSLGGDFKSLILQKYNCYPFSHETHRKEESSFYLNCNYSNQIKEEKDPNLTRVISRVKKINKNDNTDSPNSEIQYFQNLMLFNPCSFYTIQKFGVFSLFWKKQRNSIYFLN